MSMEELEQRVALLEVANETLFSAVTRLTSEVTVLNWVLLLMGGELDRPGGWRRGMSAAIPGTLDEMLDEDTKAQADRVIQNLANWAKAARG